jgi:nitrogen fixation NifU-like protein
MSDLSQLYQEVILDHNKSPRNFYKIENPTNFAEGYNPLCGDHIYVYLKIENNIIKEISFQGNGCAISKSSASLMTTILKGKTVSEAKDLFEKFHKIITSDPLKDIEIEEPSKLKIFAGVREFPTRIKCASLAWHTMFNALEGKAEKISTE